MMAKKIDFIWLPQDILQLSVVLLTARENPSANGHPEDEAYEYKHHIAAQTSDSTESWGLEIVSVTLSALASAS